MKLTNGDIWGAREHLLKLNEYLLPVLTSKALLKLERTLDEHLGVMGKVVNKLLVQYGEKQPNGNFTFPIPENEQKYNEEIQKLMAEEIEIEFQKVKLPEKIAATCDKCHHNMDKDLLLSTRTLMALDKFLEV